MKTLSRVFNPSSASYFLFGPRGTRIYRSLRPSGPLDRPEEIQGAALEGLVAQHLRSWIDYRSGSEKMYYWRTYGGAEVDFVIYGSETFAAIEVKNANRLREEDFRGMKSFGRMYPQAQRIILFRGKERTRKHGVHCIPVERFLLSLHPKKSLSENNNRGPQDKPG